MATRSKKGLERWEAALIKAMWAAGGFTKQKITSYFTHPGRDINQGRISQIVDGKMLKDVPQASKSQLEAFLANWEDKSAVKAKVFVADPLHETTVREIIRVKRGSSCLDVGESDYIECKQQLHWERRERICKAMAGMANNRGGYIVLGVEDGTCEIKGLPSGKLDIDPAQITDFLNNHFAPSIRWDHVATKLAGQSVAIIYVYEAQRKPVMCVSDRNAGAGGISKGDVYYRYPGQTARIGYPELEAIIRGREEAIQRRWQAMIDRMRNIGIENAAVLDTVSGRVDGARGSFFVDEDLLKKVSFVREGQLSDTSGQPTLRIVGNVEPVNRTLIQPVKEVKGELFEDDLLQDFFDQVQTTNGKAYVRTLAHVSARWLPIYFYIGQSGWTVEEAIKELSGVSTRNEANRRWQIDRLRRRRKPPSMSGAKHAEIASQVANKTAIDVTSKKTAREFLQAIRTVSAAQIDLTYVMPLLSECMRRYYGRGADDLSHDLRQTACYIDVICFMPPQETKTLTAPVRVREQSKASTPDQPEAMQSENVESELAG